MILTKAARTEFDVDFEIDIKIRNHSLNTLLMIVPTNRRIRALTREMVARSPGKVTGKLNLETIGSVSSRLFFNTDEIKSELISEAAASVILAQSFNEIKLNYFSDYKGEIPKGTVDRVRNVISEYKRHGITPAGIRTEAQSLSGSEKQKALDISNVYLEYQRKIDSLGLKETGDIYSGLTGLDSEEVIHRFRSLYPEVELIIIMGFDEFTLPEVEIINRLSDIVNSELFLSFDYYRYNPLIFSHLDTCYENLLSRGFKEITDESYSLFTRFQNEIRENLFLKKNNPLIEVYRNDIKTIIALTREREIELIASEIKDLIVKEKVKPEEICVVFNLISNYSGIIRDIFPVYGLPFNLTDRFRLNTASHVVALISFLEIAENNFYYKNIFRALSGGIIEIGGINLTNLLRTSIKLKIISGFDGWQRSLNDAINSIEESGNGYEDNDEETEFYIKALNDIDLIRSYLDPFLDRMTISEFRENLKSLINKFEIPVKILSADADETEKNIKAVNIFLELIEDILSLLEEQSGTKQKFPLKFFLHNLRTAVSSSRYNINEKSGYGIQLTSMNEIRGLKFGYLFIGGLCDGDFPTRFSPEIFFSGSMAKVKGEINHITEQRYLFYQSLSVWNKKLYLTFPARDERKEFVQSDFLREFRNTFEVTDANEMNYRDKIYTREQLLTIIGRYGYENAGKSGDLSAAGINKEQIEIAMLINFERAKMPFAESSYSGFISEALSDKGKAKLEKIRERQFSITQLETYAVCPYKYFAERVLKLNIFEEPTEEIEALEVGSLIHSILYNFYTVLKKEQIILVKCSDEEFRKAEKILFEIAERKIADVNFNSALSFFEREKILGIDGNRKNSVLYKFLSAERESEGGYIPEFFEAAFGQVKEEEEQNMLLDRLNVDDITLRGKIDRIDLNRDQKYYKVFDYKSGKSRLNKQDMYDGLQLQLPLYLYAAKEIIKSELNENYEPAGALIYSLNYNTSDFGRKEINFGKRAKEEEIKAQYTELIKICLNAIKKYVDGISRGDFRLTQLEKREEKACRFCGFRPICRIQEVGEGERTS